MKYVIFNADSTQSLSWKIGKAMSDGGHLVGGPFMHDEPAWRGNGRQLFAQAMLMPENYDVNKHQTRA